VIARAHNFFLALVFGLLAYACIQAAIFLNAIGFGSINVGSLFAAVCASLCGVYLTAACIKEKK
jgi:hypothetical protein